jgi:Putative MetA-pathway of phenol degradation
MFEMIKLRELSDETLGAAAHADAPPAVHHEEEAGHGHAEADGHSPHSLKSIESINIALAYGVTDDFTVSARLPFVRRTDIREGLFFNEHPELGENVGIVETLGDASGVGDVTLLGQYRFLKVSASGFEMAALLGVKLPTGKTSENTNEDERFEAEFQPGSGSWDGQFGLAATMRSGPWSFDTSALYHLVTEGTQNTDLGDRLLYGVALSYRVMGGPAAEEHVHADGAVHLHKAASQTLNVDLVLELNGEWHDKQKAGIEVDDNSGGHTLYVSPGVRLSAGDWSGFASVGIPVVEDMNGLQPDPDWKLVTGVAFSF